MLGAIKYFKKHRTMLVKLALNSDYAEHLFRRQRMEQFNRGFITNINILLIKERNK